MISLYLVRQQTTSYLVKGQFISNRVGIEPTFQWDRVGWVSILRHISIQPIMLSCYFSCFSTETYLSIIYDDNSIPSVLGLTFTAKAVFHYRLSWLFCHHWQHDDYIENHRMGKTRDYKNAGTMTSGHDQRLRIHGTFPRIHTVNII